MFAAARDAVQMRCGSSGQGDLAEPHRLGGVAGMMRSCSRLTAKAQVPVVIQFRRMSRHDKRASHARTSVVLAVEPVAAGVSEGHCEGGLRTAGITGHRG